MNNSNAKDLANGSARAFSRVATRLEANDAPRSLWLKLLQELDTGGVSSARTYSTFMLEVLKWTKSIWSR